MTAVNSADRRCEDVGASEGLDWLEKHVYANHVHCD